MTLQPVPERVLGDARQFGKSGAESPLRRYSATASARASAVLRTRPRASRFKIVSWLFITWDIPDSPHAPFQPYSHGNNRDAYKRPKVGLYHLERR